MLDEATRVELINHRTTCAYWYAVGFSDGSGNLDVAEEFRQAYHTEAAAYYNGDAFSLRSVPDAYRAFTAETGVAA